MNTTNAEQPAKARPTSLDYFSHIEAAKNTCQNKVVENDLTKAHFFAGHTTMNAVWKFIKTLRILVFAVSAVLGSVAWYVILRKDDPEALKESVGNQFEFYSSLINNFFNGFGLWQSPINTDQQVWLVIWVFFAFVNFKFLQGVGRRLKNINVDKYHRYQKYARDGKRQFREYGDMPFEEFLKTQGYMNDGTILSVILSLLGPILPAVTALLFIVTMFRPNIATALAMMAVVWYGSALLLETALFFLLRGISLL